MKNNANNLRELSRAQGASQSLNYKTLGHSPMTISISSGKGGVGKTVAAVHLAYAWQKNGYRVLLLDGDFGLANVDVLLDLRAKYNIFDLLENNVETKDLILEGPAGMHVIPSGSGIHKLVDLDDIQRAELFDQLDQLANNYDIFLIDTGAGIAKSVVHLNLAAQFNLIVTTPEPHAITDAYAMIKVLSEHNHNGKISLLVNLVNSEPEALKIYERISDVAGKFLNQKVDYAGHILKDPQIQSLIMKKQTISNLTQHTISGQLANSIARKIVDVYEQSETGNFNFVEKLLERRTDSFEQFDSERMRTNTL